MPIDVPCSHCGREPSHPQIQHRFIYAAYYRPETTYDRGQRCYIAALCAPCFEVDRQARTRTAQNRFFRQVSRWSSLASNRNHIVWLLEHPEGATGEEWEADNCFQNGVAAPCRTLVVAAKRA
jgi:hypothetical protein